MSLLLSLVSLAAPRGFRRLIDEKVQQIINQSKPVDESPATPAAVAAETVASTAAPRQPLPAAARRLEFLSRPHLQMGVDDAEMHHSHQGYQDHVSSLADEHKLILALEIVEKKLELHQAELDQGTIGPDTERQDQYRKRIARLNEELDQLVTESKIKDHVTDDASGCQFAIKLYRQGHNIGFNKHFKMTGQQK